MSKGTLGRTKAAKGEKVAGGRRKHAAIHRKSNTPLNEKEELQRLAKLKSLEYERERGPAAKRLGIRVMWLDNAVDKCRPKDGANGQGRPLELLEIDPWPEPVNGAELLDSVCTEVGKYLVMPPGGAEISALWAAHTYAFQSFAVTPRLAITSPEKRCGKTTLLDVIAKLVVRPMPVANITAPMVFRTVEKVKPTLLIDEADTFLARSDELRGLLNSGHRQGGQAIRGVGDDYEPRQFSTWSPVAIAMIGKLPDTLEDRSIELRLRRRKAAEVVQSFRFDATPDLDRLKRMLARWTDDNRDTLSKANPDMGALVNREADNWRPLFAIADAAGGGWGARARAIAQAASVVKEDQSLRVRLLTDCRQIIAARPSDDRISSKTLAEALAGLEGCPWAEWGKTGGPITTNALARMLAAFGIHPRSKRRGTETFKGYDFGAFEEAFARYLPIQTVTPSQPNNHGRFDASQTVTVEHDVTDLKSQIPNNHGHCDVVTVENGGSPNMQGEPPSGYAATETLMPSEIDEGTGDEDAGIWRRRI